MAAQAIVDHFDRVNATLRAIERDRINAQPRHLDALMTFAARAYRRPLSKEERADLLAFYRSQRETKSLSHEEAMRDAIVSILMSPHFCYRLDLSRCDRGLCLITIWRAASATSSGRRCPTRRCWHARRPGVCARAPCFAPRFGAC